jgi:hypothetical protein
MLSFIARTGLKYERGTSECFKGYECNISNLLYEFCKTLFCGTRFLDHEERSEECYKANKCDKIAYKTNVIQYFFALILNLTLKKSSKHDARKIIHIWQIQRVGDTGN